MAKHESALQWHGKQKKSDGKTNGFFEISIQTVDHVDNFSFSVSLKFDDIEKKSIVTGLTNEVVIPPEILYTIGIIR